MSHQKTTFYPQLGDFITSLQQEKEQIPEGRLQQLHQLAEYIRNKKSQGASIQLNFICTHNSRRSIISQLWAFAAAAHFGVELTVFSGGTEATAFNPRAVAAMERAGFMVDNPGGTNPHYLVTYQEGGPSLECFSKTFDDPFNPAANFAAIMTCAQADENCPFVPGTEFRLSLTYEDPKVADDTPQETERYDERVRQIGREIFFMMEQVGQ